MAKKTITPETALPDMGAEDTETQDTQARFYAGEQEIDSDLFKLDVQDMVKNTAMDGAARPLWVNFEHSHCYRTVDGQGQPQRYCAPVGGHFHEMIVTPSKNGKAPKVVVGPALRMVIRTGDNGRPQRVAEPMKHDKHTHKAHYVVSQKVKMQKVNPEFAKLQGHFAAKEPAPVPGVTER